MDGLTKSARGNVPRYISTSEEIKYIPYSVHSIFSLIQELPSESENCIDIQIYILALTIYLVHN